MGDNCKQCTLCERSAGVWVSCVTAAGAVYKAALCDTHARACGWLCPTGWDLLDGWNLPQAQPQAPHSGGQDELLQSALKAMVQGVASITGGHFKSVSVQLHTSEAKTTEPKQPHGQTDGCPDCGFTVADWKAHGRLGCPKCYRTYAHSIRRQLPHLHGGEHVHWGKIPQGQQAAIATAKTQRIKRLRERLATAIRSENYEQASRLRDSIRSLEPPTA